MAISITHFDHLADGRAVEKITLINDVGTAVSVLSLGVTIQAFHYEGKDIVLGFESIEDYFRSTAYIGATVGRVCNRTADGRFSLGGKEYQLACNEAERHVHLHGGMMGLDKRVWDYSVVDDGATPQVAFTLTSPDGEEGYPGNLTVSVTVTLTPENTLVLDYLASTDADTPVNLTNHAYFNLNGCDGGDVRDTMLCVHAQEFTPVNERLIPTGEYASVVGTALDFRSYKAIGDALNSGDSVLEHTGGVDHNFVLAHGRRAVTEIASAYSPHTDIRLTCCSDLPGVQVYTGNFLDESTGKYGLAWRKHHGFCIETQFFPDSMNQPTFPSIILKAGEVFSSRTTYHVDRLSDRKGE